MANLKEFGVTRSCGHACKVMVDDDYYTRYFITGVKIQFISHRSMYGCTLPETLVPVVQWDAPMVRGQYTGAHHFATVGMYAVIR